MTDDDSWRQRLQPPAGGLARLHRSVETRSSSRGIPPWRSPLAWASAAIAAVMAIGVTQYVQRAPQRAFERNLRSALATMPTDEVVERGIARELPSSRADVRIVELAPAEPAR
jgi:hypothetical protein